MSEEKGLVAAALKEVEQVKVTKEDIKNYFCPKANEKEVFMALGIIKSLNLNPFTREVHLIKYGDNDKLSIIVGYEVYLKRADRTGKMGGWTAGVDKIKGIAWVRIIRKDWTEPFLWEVSIAEFNKGQATWKSMPDFMAKKVAIAQGFRLAFPDELGGMPYTQEEYQAYDINGLGTSHSSGKPEVQAPQARSVKQNNETVIKGIDEALSSALGEIINVSGQLLKYVERKSSGKTPKDITDYTIGREDCQEIITITKWGKLHEGLQTGDILLFKEVEVSEFKGEKKFMAKVIEIILPEETNA